MFFIVGILIRSDFIIIIYEQLLNLKQYLITRSYHQFNLYKQSPLRLAAILSDTFFFIRNTYVFTYSYLLILKNRGAGGLTRGFLDVRCHHIIF